MKYVPVGLIEEFVLNYSAVPRELDGWRYYRCELGGHAQSCFKEVPFWMPPMANSYVIEMLFDFWQAPKRQRRKILHHIIQELERGVG